MIICEKKLLDVKGLSTERRSTPLNMSVVRPVVLDVTWCENETALGKGNLEFTEIYKASIEG